MEAALLSGEHSDRDIFVARPDGERVPVRMRISPLHAPEGPIEGVVELFTDNSGVAHALELANAIQDTAFTDPLTGLGNRRALSMIAESRFAAIQSTTTGFALLMAGNVLMTLPMLIMFLVFQRYFIQAMTMSGMKG